MKSSGGKGFTLVELLAVVAVMAIVLSLSVGAVNSLKRSSALTQGAQDLANELARARQIAVTKNRAVEVRFYCDESNPGTGSYYRSFQMFEYTDEGGAIAVGKQKWFPGGVILDSDPTLSTLLASAQKKTWNPATDPQPPLPQVGLQYRAAPFRFRPDGSTDLSISGSQWFVTLHDLVDGDGLTTLPDNYATIQVDPINGVARSYGP